MIVKQSILTTLLLSAHSNAKDGAKFRDAKAIPQNGPAHKLRGGVDLQTVGFGGVGLGLARDSGSKNGKEEENSSSASSLVHNDPESSGRYNDYDSESVLKAMDEDFQYHELLVDSNGGVANGSEAAGGKEEKKEQDATAMFGGNNNKKKKKSASAASSLYAEELVGEGFVKEMLGDAFDAGSNKPVSEGHGDNNFSANEASSSTGRNGGSLLVSTSSSTDTKTSSSSDNGRSEGLTGGGEEDMKGGTGNNEVGGIHGVRVSNSKKGTYGGDGSNLVKTPQDVMTIPIVDIDLVRTGKSDTGSDTGSLVDKQESRNLFESSSSSCYRVTFETAIDYLVRTDIDLFCPYGEDHDYRVPEDQCLAAGLEVTGREGIDVVNQNGILAVGDWNDGAPCGCFLKKLGNLNYDDRFHIQNNTPEKYLSGARYSGNAHVVAGEFENLSNTRFYIESSPRNNSMKGTCVKYGDPIYIRVSVGLDRWLMIDNDEPNAKVYSRDINHDSQIISSYEWIIRSNMTADKIDTFHGSCVDTNFAIYLQWNGSENKDRWMALQESINIVVKDTNSATNKSEYQWSFQLMSNPNAWKVDNFEDAVLDRFQFQITYNRGHTCAPAATTAGLLCKRPNYILKDGVKLLGWNSHDSCREGCHLETKTDTDGTYLEITQTSLVSGSFWILDNIQFDEGEDFSMLAKLKVNGVDGTSSDAGFYINDRDWFAFDLSNKIGTTSDSAFYDDTLPENFFKREDFGTHSDNLFTFQIERVDGRISFYITAGNNGEKKLVASNEYNEAINKFKWRPWNGMLKIYEWSFPTYSSSDFIVEGYLNENQTSVIPSFCHDKPGANCTLEICDVDVEKIVIKASEETPLVPKNYWKMKAFGSGVYDLDTFHLISNESPLDIFLDTPCVDDTNWTVGGSSVYSGMMCDDFANKDFSRTIKDTWCETIMALDDSINMGKSIEDACCACGGSALFSTHPSLAPTNAPTISQMPTAPTAQPTACVNDNWYLDEDTGLGCESIAEDMCDRFDDHIYNRKSVKEACCVCNGGKHISVFPSFLPTDQPSNLPTLSPTSLPSDQPSTVFSKNLAQAKPILDTLQVLSIQVGSDLVSAHPVNDTDATSLFDDTGFFICNNSSINLHGNAWKVFKLPEKYNVTSNTQLKLDIDVEDKANGHLICFAEEISEDLDFDDKNCLSLIDTEAEMWSNVQKAYNLALRKKTVTASPASIPFSWLGSSNAVDGLSTNFSLVKRENGNDVAWIKLDLGKSVTLSRIEVSSIFGLPQSLTVTLDESEGERIWTFENGKVDFTGGTSTRYLTLTSYDNLLISNIEVIGNSDLSSITYPLALLFDGCEPKFQYIALVQDSSSDKNEGRSTISNIRFSETVSSNDQSQVSKNDLGGQYLRLSHIESGKTLAIGGIKNVTGKRIASLTDSEDFDMSQIILLRHDGKLQSLQFPDYYLTIVEDDNCKIEFEKVIENQEYGTTFLLDPFGEKNIFVQCVQELKALTVVNDVLSLGIGNDEQNWKLTALGDSQQKFISALENSSLCYQKTLQSVFTSIAPKTWEFLLADNLDIFAIKKAGTGTNSTEVHVLSRNDNKWSFSLQTGTNLPETGDNWQFLLAPRNRDLYAIKKEAKAGATEVYVLSKESNYQSLIQYTDIATDNRWWEATWEFMLAPNLDLYEIKKTGTHSSRTEVHVLSRESNYQSFSLHKATALSETNDDWQFLLAPNLDLFAIKKAGTDTKSTEVHVLGASNYQGFILNRGTALHETDDNWKFLLAPNRDLYAINMKTETGGFIVYGLSGDPDYGSISEPESTATWKFIDGYMNLDGTNIIPQSCIHSGNCVVEICGVESQSTRTHKCHDIELKRLTNSIGTSATELKIRSSIEGSVPDGSFDFAINTKYYLEDSLDLKTENENFNPYIEFQVDGNIVVVFQDCGTIASLATNTKGCQQDYKASFTNDGRILLQCKKENEDFSYYYPRETESGLNDRNEVCKLKYFDGRGVCMFPDGIIAYELPGDKANQKCARAKSFKIPGYTIPTALDDPMRFRNSLPEECVEDNSSCRLRVCGVETLRIPSSADVSKYSILNDSGYSLRRTWHSTDDFYEYELKSSAFGGRSVNPTTPVSFRVDTYSYSKNSVISSRRRLLSERKLSLEEDDLLSNRQDEQFEISSDGNRRLADGSQSNLPNDSQIKESLGKRQLVGTSPSYLRCDPASIPVAHRQQYIELIKNRGECSIYPNHHTCRWIWCLQNSVGVNQRHDTSDLNTLISLAPKTWEFLLAENLDIYVIKKAGTGTGSTEVHVLSRESNYESFSLQTGTNLPETGDNWQFILAPDYDLYAIKMDAKAGATEVFVLSEASNYQSLIQYTDIATDNTWWEATWEFMLAPNLDLYEIKKTGTHTSRTEVHVLSRESNYQSFSRNIVTALSETNDDWQFLLAPNLDLFAIKKAGTDTKST